MELTAVAAWLNASFADFDMAIMLAVHKLYDAAAWFFSPVLETITFFGNGGICLIIFSIFLIFFQKTRRFGTAMLLGIIIGALFTNVWLKVAIARPRPYADASSVFHQIWVTMGQHMESDKSFPSGHTTSAFACMTPLFFAKRKSVAISAFAFAFLMGISRIYLAVHYPSDVLAGMIVGFIAGCLGAFIASKLPAKWYKLKFKKTKKDA